LRRSRPSSFHDVVAADEPQRNNPNNHKKKTRKKENNKRRMTYPSHAVALVHGGQSGGG
jgi:hypothetical protein